MELIQYQKTGFACGEMKQKQKRKSTSAAESKAEISGILNRSVPQVCRVRFRGGKYFRRDARDSDDV
jgi:hypothetical protein